MHIPVKRFKKKARNLNLVKNEDYRNDQRLGNVLDVFNQQEINEMKGFK